MEPLKDSLKDVRMEPHFPVVLHNRQRKYGGPPPNWTGPAPPKGSEVFIGKIPRDLMEGDLLPLFEKIGIVYEMRLMMDANSRNRGFAFVTYSNPSDATEAIHQLDHYEIQPKRFIGVIRSLDNCRLFVGGIPKDKTEEQVRKEMSLCTEDVTGVILYSSITDKSKNRGFAFVEYRSHRAATIARRKCIRDRLQLWGRVVAVDWAEPEPIVGEEILSKVRILYVRNILTSIDEDQLRELFDSASDNGVEKVKRLNDFAFIHFVTRQQAEQAMNTLQDQNLEGARMQISWAKPATERRKNSIQSRQTSAFLNQSTYPLSCICQHTNLPAMCNVHHQVNFTSHKETSTCYPPRKSFLNGYSMINSSSHNFPAETLHNRCSPKFPSTFALREECHPSFVNMGFTNNAEALISLCRLHNIGAPEIETAKIVDVERYTAKVSLPNLGLPFSVFLSTHTYSSEEEAKQAICAYALDYLQYIFRTYYGVALKI